LPHEKKHGAQSSAQPWERATLANGAAFKVSAEKEKKKEKRVKKPREV
jgi:hypothetical protein